MSLNSLNSPTYDVDSRLFGLCVCCAPPPGGEQTSIYPSPNLHPIVRPPNLLIACTILPSSHSAPTAYLPLPSPASSSSLAILPIASVLPPSSAPSHSASRVHSLPPLVYKLPSETENVDCPSSHSPLRRTSASLLNSGGFMGVFVSGRKSSSRAFAHYPPSRNIGGALRRSRPGPSSGSLAPKQHYIASR